MKKFFLKKVLPLFAGFFLVGLLIFLLRTPILIGLGNFLISVDSLENADAIFVLGGDSYDRGNTALQLFNAGYSDKIVCLGENIPLIFKTIGLTYAESELTRFHLISTFNCFNIPTRNNTPPEEKTALPDSSVIVLKIGTSTKEEVSAIIQYCNEKKLKKIILVSSKFHTRRVRMASSKKFKKENIGLIIAGAGSSVYEEEEWWKSEEGLIMVNNEYMKLIYYLLKY